MKIGAAEDFATRLLRPSCPFFAASAPPGIRAGCTRWISRDHIKRGRPVVCRALSADTCYQRMRAQCLVQLSHPLWDWYAAKKPME